MYLCFMIWMIDGYKNLSKNYIPISEKPFVSVVVAARNEELNIAGILDCLKAQNYPQNKYEVIICNDRSTDNTSKIIDYFKTDFPNLHSLNIKDLPNEWAGKKWALYNGIKKARGEIILQTDADCTVNNNWIDAIVSQFSDETIGFVCGLSPLFNKKDKSFYNKMFFLDSIAQDAFIACAIGKGLTLSATGRNIAYRKKYFFQVNGYDEINNIISGDDDLLLHKIVYYANCKVKFILDNDATVYSNPPITFNQFLHQRLRFASKGFIYYNKNFISKELKIILPFLYIVNFSVAISLIAFCNNMSFLYLLPFLIKIIPDIIYIYSFKDYIELKNDLFIMIFTSVIHPFYIIIFGLLGPIYNFKWK